MSGSLISPFHPTVVLGFSKYARIIKSNSFSTSGKKSFSKLAVAHISHINETSRQINPTFSKWECRCTSVLICVYRPSGVSVYVCVHECVPCVNYYAKVYVQVCMCQLPIIIGVFQCVCVCQCVCMSVCMCMHVCAFVCHRVNLTMFYSRCQCVCAHVSMCVCACQ